MEGKEAYCSAAPAVEIVVFFFINKTLFNILVKHNDRKETAWKIARLSRLKLETCHIIIHEKISITMSEYEHSQKIVIICFFSFYKGNLKISHLIFSNRDIWAKKGIFQ